MASMRNSSSTLEDNQDDFNEKKVSRVKKVRVNTDDNVIIGSSLDEDEATEADLNQEDDDTNSSTDILSQEITGTLTKDNNMGD